MAPAAMCVRVMSNVRMAILKPSPSAPSRFSTGTSTSSRIRLAVCEARMPIFFSFLPGFTPFQSFSTMKVVTASVPRDGSTVAKTTYTSARPALVMNVLEPLRMYRSPARRARVAIPAGSEPAPGSVRAYAPRVGRPPGAHLQSHDMYFSFCSSVPPSRMGVAASATPPMIDPIPAHPQKISSSTMALASTLSTPPPPYFSGNEYVISPAWCAFSNTSHGTSSFSSASDAAGRMVFSANLWAMSRNSRCSSVSVNPIMNLPLADSEWRMALYHPPYAIRYNVIISIFLRTSSIASWSRMFSAIGNRICSSLPKCMSSRRMISSALALRASALPPAAAIWRNFAAPASIFGCSTSLSSWSVWRRSSPCPWISLCSSRITPVGPSPVPMMASSAGKNASSSFFAWRANCVSIILPMRPSTGRTSGNAAFPRVARSAAAFRKSAICAMMSRCSSKRCSIGFMCPPSTGTQENAGTEETCVSSLSSRSSIPLCQPLLHIRQQAAPVNDALQESGERLGAVGFAAREIADRAGGRFHFDLIPLGDAVHGRCAFQDRQADVNRVAEEDARKRLGDDGGHAGGFDADRRDLARRAAPEVRLGDDHVAALHLPDERRVSVFHAMLGQFARVGGVAVPGRDNGVRVNVLAELPGFAANARARGQHGLPYRAGPAPGERVEEQHARRHGVIAEALGGKGGQLLGDDIRAGRAHHARGGQFAEDRIRHTDHRRFSYTGVRAQHHLDRAGVNLEAT